METKIDMELIRQFFPKPSMSMKDAMAAFANGEKIEYRVCIPGLPESENPWCLIDEKKPQFDEDWDYRIYVDRKKVLERCSMYKILDVERLYKIEDTNVLLDLVETLDSFRNRHNLKLKDL